MTPGSHSDQGESWSPDPQSAARKSAAASSAGRKNRSAIWNPVNRRSSREWALQALFQLDVNPPESGDLAVLFEAFWKQQVLLSEEKDATAPTSPPSDSDGLEGDSAASTAPAAPSYKQRREAVAPKTYRDFAEELVRGVWENRDAIDQKIEGYLDNWSLSRIGGVERNVLRLAFYELFFREETPPVVIINEAVDVAKFFSTREAGRFVNGILDRAGKDVPRSARERMGVKPPARRK